MKSNKPTEKQIALFQQAHVLSQQGKIAEAAQLLTKAVQFAPEHPLCHLWSSVGRITAL
ncbi:MAG: tetratricopeptide repeat protein [Methylomonas sp.]|jgi:hypothetical protein